MAALIKDRNTPSRAGDKFSLPVATLVAIYAGSIVMLNATGYATPGATATGQVAAGRAAEQVDNSAGADGAVNVEVETGVFQFANSASTDEITAAEVGDTCYIVDDQTVAKTDGTGTRSAAGKVVGVDSDGVWVRMGL
jgi:hypothetical protein